MASLWQTDDLCPGGCGLPCPCFELPYLLAKAPHLWERRLPTPPGKGSTWFCTIQAGHQVLYALNSQPVYAEAEEASIEDFSATDDFASSECPGFFGGSIQPTQEEINRKNCSCLALLHRARKGKKGMLGLLKLMKYE